MIGKWLYNILTRPKVRSKINIIGEKIQVMSPCLYESVFLKSKSKIKKHAFTENFLEQNRTNTRNIINIANFESLDKKPLVSVIVPNYNHMDYLCERLDSIYNQTYKNIEVILLDDLSTDESVKILNEYKNKYSHITSLYINDVNGNGVFKQWKKGINLAKGDYIWIAESDDYCSTNFLEELIPAFQDESVMLAFARSIFIRNGEQIYSTQEYLADINGIRWNRPFVMAAHMAVKKAFGLKNIIPNVSSAVFRNTGKITKEMEKIWGEVKLCGDWLFYLNLIKGGIIYYTNKATNYYRIHDNSTSLNIQKSSRYYKEHEMVAMYVAQNYDVPNSIFELQKKNLEDHYIAFNNGKSKEDILQWYDIEKIIRNKENRLPNVLMAGFSMSMGGGETFPIMLANAFKEAGVAITYIDFQMSNDDEKVREMLNRDIPLIKVKKIPSFLYTLEQLGAEIIHSHHACVDEVISYAITNQEKCKHIITLHGMYEAIVKDDLLRLLPKIKSSCSQFIYTAEKNLVPFKENSIDITDFKKIGNGLGVVPINVIERSSLNISQESFVLCLVSRGIPEKGWKEAIDAVVLARQISGKDIDLLLIGDGVMYDLLKDQSPSFIHFLGVRSNIRDYFSMSDMGFLPSRFPGESYPLVIIDSLFCNKPVIASNIGEIKLQMQDESGNLAGKLFELTDWQIPIEEVANIIAALSNRGTEYQNMLKYTISASKKFNIKEICNQYMKLYRKACLKDEV